MIIVDICNTLADVNSVLLEEFSIDEVYGYKIPADFFVNNLWVFDKAKAFDGAADFLNGLVKLSGEEVIYLTARPVSSYFITKNWLKRNNFPDGKVIFVKSDKALFLKKNGVEDISRIFEDSPSEINEYKEVYKDSKVLIKKMPYNEAYDTFESWTELVV